MISKGGVAVPIIIVISKGSVAVPIIIVISKGGVAVPIIIVISKGSTNYNSDKVEAIRLMNHTHTHTQQCFIWGGPKDQFPPPFSP